MAKTNNITTVDNEIAGSSVLPLEAGKIKLKITYPAIITTTVDNKGINLFIIEVGFVDWLTLGSIS